MSTRLRSTFDPSIKPRRGTYQLRRDEYFESLVAAYMLDEGGGAIINNATGRRSGYGTAMNWANDGARFIAAGTSYVNLTDEPWTAFRSGRLSVWALVSQIGDAASFRTILSKPVANGSWSTPFARMFLAVDNANKVKFSVNDANQPAATTAIGATSITVLDPTQLGGTYDGATVRAYLNGRQDGSSAYAEPASTPSVVGVGTKGETVSGNCTPGAPAGTPAPGDIWICAVCSRDQVAMSMTADWTEIVQGNGGSTTCRLAVFWHRHNGSTTPSLVITHTAGDSIVAGTISFRGLLETGSPVNTFSSIAAGTDATMEHTAITPSVACVLLAVNGAGDDNARTALGGDYLIPWEDSSGGTQNCYITALGNDASVALNYDLSVPASTTGTVTQTMAASDPWAATLIALQPAAKPASYPIEYSTQPITLGGRSTSSIGEGWSGLIHAVLIFNQHLPPQWFQERMADPYGFLEPIRQSRRFSAPNANITATPDTLALTLTKYAPVVSTPRLATPGVKNLTITGLAPTVSTPRLATPGKLTMTLSTFAPSVTVTNNQRVTPDVKALVLSTFAPAVSTPRTATPPTKSLALSTFAPVVSTPRLVTPGKLSLTTSLFAPTVSSPRLVTPGKVDLALSTFSPVIGRGVVPGTLALTLTGLSPVVSTPRTATPSTLALTTTKFAPTVSTPRLSTPGKLSLITSGFAPTVLVSVTATPGTLSQTLTMYAPSVQTPRLATPITKALSLSTFAPSIANNSVQVPATLSLVLTGYAPTVAVGDAQAIVPGTKALILTTFAPTIVNPRTVTPSTKALTLTKFAPVVSTPRLATPGTRALTLATYAALVSVPRLVTPSPLSLVLVTFAPSVGNSVIVVPDTLDLILTTYQALVSASGGSSGDRVVFNPSIFEAGIIR